MRDASALWWDRAGTGAADLVTTGAGRSVVPPSRAGRTALARAFAAENA
jgi:hypothetical protein